MGRFGLGFAVLGLFVLLVGACDDTADTSPGTSASGGGSSCPSSASCPSFASDIYPSMKGSGAWRCADSSCHGGGRNAPAIDDSSASACLNSLKAVTIRGKAYIAGGSDPSASSILCNVQGACGEKMPKSPAPSLSNAEVCKIEAWLKCGAPP
jgi:hypothetical protein